MKCPHCQAGMQTFQLDGLELDRCHACGRVWLDFDEVDRVYGAAELSVTEVEIDAECPRGHGVLRSGGVDDQVVEVCPTCRGVLVAEQAPPRPAEVPAAPASRPPAKAPAPGPVVKQEAVTVSCDHCQKVIPVGEATMSNRGLVCRDCDLEERPMSTADKTLQGVLEGLGRAIGTLLSGDG